MSEKSNVTSKPAIAGFLNLLTMLDNTLQEQLKNIFAALEAHYTFDIHVAPEHENRKELIDLLEDVAACSDKINCLIHEGEHLEFKLLKDGKATGISFRGIPTGHEFTSLLLAILNSDGKGKNFPDKTIANRIKALRGPIHLSTYVSLTCTNCPDVVQILNVMSVLNPSIHHEMIDGAIYQDEVERLKLQGVPAVFADGELLHVGRGEFGEILEKLEKRYGINASEIKQETQYYDVVVLGGGPAGSSAAIYSARKGLKVAVIAERIGGQVKETLGIENLISVPQTTGNELADHLRVHLQQYPIDILEHRRVDNITLKGKEKILTTTGGEIISTPALILATGASWRKLNIPGEAEYIGRGVAFCPHCDGPFYKGRHVAVIGGGNSGIEAAIDLAGICSKVTVLEFLDELKADQVLQEKARTISNIEIFTSRKSTRIIGNGDKVTGIEVENRTTGESQVIPLDGIFVQIGLSPNSSIVKELVKINRTGEIVIDGNCRTEIPGIYAAGDVSSIPYKQIIIAMGEGAKAALSAFDDRIRGII